MYKDDIGDIDLEDSQKGLPERAFLPSSPDGSYRSSMGISSSQPPQPTKNNEELEPGNEELPQHRIKKAIKKKKTTKGDHGWQGQLCITDHVQRDEPTHDID